MTSDQFVLSTPEDFRQYQMVLLSAPSDLYRYKRSVQPALRSKPQQCLFGCDAQLYLFAATLRQLGLNSWFLPAPDIVPDTTFLKRYLGLSETVNRTDAILHVSFGLPFTTRILRRAKNVAVSAIAANSYKVSESSPTLEVANLFPAGIQGVLAYNDLPQPARTLDERELPVCILAKAFSDEPRSASTIETTLDLNYQEQLNSDCLIQSVLEYSASDWERRDCRATPQSRDLRRAFIRHDCSEKQSKSLHFVLMPWNVANTRSLVPDVAKRLSSASERGEYELGVILIPFNDHRSGPNRVQALVNACTQAATPGCANTIFVMRDTSPQSVNALRATVTRCWVDGTDPEWQWNVKRLAQLGFKVLLLAEPTMETFVNVSPFRPMIDKVFEAENACSVNLDDGSSGVTANSYTMSVRGMRQLLRYTKEVAVTHETGARTPVRAICMNQSEK